MCVSMHTTLIYWTCGVEILTSNMSSMKLPQLCMCVVIWPRVKKPWVKHWKEFHGNAKMMIYSHKWTKLRRNFLESEFLGAPDSAMRVLSMWLMKKSRKVVQVNTSMRAEWVSLPKTKKQLSQLHDDDEDVFATSLIDRYAARPSCLDKKWPCNVCCKLWCSVRLQWWH